MFHFMNKTTPWCRLCSQLWGGFKLRLGFRLTTYTPLEPAFTFTWKEGSFPQFPAVSFPRRQAKQHLTHRSSTLFDLACPLPTQGNGSAPVSVLYLLLLSFGFRYDSLQKGDNHLLVPGSKKHSEPAAPEGLCCTAGI